MKHILGSSILQTVNFIVTLAVSFFMTPFLIGQLGEYHYGIWILIGSIVSYFSLSEAGVGSAVQNELSLCAGKGDREGFLGAFSNGLVLHLGVSLIVGFVTALSVVVVLAGGDLFREYRLIAMLLAISGTTLAISYLFLPYGSVLISQVRLDVTAAIAIASTLGTALLTVLVVSRGFGLLGMALAGLSVSLGANLLILVCASRTFPGIRFSRDMVTAKGLKAMVRYGAKTLMIQISDILRFRCDEVVVGSLISIPKVTYYNVANRLATISNEISMKSLAVLNPLFARYAGSADKERLQGLFVLSIKWSGALSAAVFAALVFLGKDFLGLWLGVSFYDSFAPMLLLSAALLVGRMQAPAVSLFYATNTHHYFVYMSLIEGIANLGLSILLVLQFGMGIVGVALGTLIPIVVVKVFVQPHLVARVMGFTVGFYYLLLGRVAGSGILVYGLAYVLAPCPAPVTYVRLLASLPFFLIPFLIHLLLILDRNERSLLMAHFSPRFFLRKRGTQG